jgi:hypothetical protein
MSVEHTVWVLVYGNEHLELAKRTMLRAWSSPP